SKRTTSWRTMMVIPEMESELKLAREHEAHLAELDELEQTRFQLNLERAAQALNGVRDGVLKNEVRVIGQRIKTIEREVSDAVNPAWGQLFRDRGELSAFGAQIEDYACVYTSRASNLRLYSPFWYFRSPRDRMAHELHR
ncbi:MAG: 5'-nucleotidase, partial [Myxococcota bacterium]